MCNVWYRSSTFLLLKKYNVYIFFSVVTLPRSEDCATYVSYRLHIGGIGDMNEGKYLIFDT